MRFSKILDLEASDIFEQIFGGRGGFGGMEEE